MASVMTGDFLHLAKYALRSGSGKVGLFPKSELRLKLKYTLYGSFRVGRIMIRGRFSSTLVTDKLLQGVHGM